MPASTKWAAALALILIALAIGGGAMWQRRHPTASLPAELAGLLPTPSGATGPEAKVAPAPSAALPPPAAVAPASTETLARQAVAAPQAPPATNKAPAASIVPHFDVVRVEPKGDTVVAGTSAPNARVALLAGGKVLAEGKADGTGQFVLLPPPLPPGDHALTLRQSDAEAGGATADVVSAQSVAVSVPKAGQGQVLVALAEPGRPTKLLSPPATSTPGPARTERAPSAAEPESRKPAVPNLDGARPGATPPRDLAIRSVELENGTGFYASGTAKAGTPVHVYLNEAHLADVVAGPDGVWSVTIRKGLAGGHYVVRADADSGLGVTARVEVPFDVPAAMAQAARIVSPGDSHAPGLASLARPATTIDDAQARASAERAKRTPDAGPPKIAESRGRSNDGAAPAPAPRTTAAETEPPASAARAVIEEVQTREVADGDNLWKISRERLGYGKRFTQIYAANAAQIRDPALIYPGQIFVLPRK